MRTLGPRLKAVRSHVAQELGRAKRQVARQQAPEEQGAEGTEVHQPPTRGGGQEVRDA